MKRKDINQQTFFELLKTGLWGNGNPDIRIDGVTDWQEVYQLAQEQSVQGLLLQGIETVQGSWLKDHGSPLVPKVLLLQWIGEVQVIEQRNKEMNVFIAELLEKLRKNDIYALLVKGQGIAQCYEKPLWRCSGDVDLFLSEDNYMKAKSVLIPLSSSVDEEYKDAKHQGMTIDGRVVELHGNLHCALSSRVVRGMNEIYRETFYNGNVRSWMNGGTQIFLLSVENDVLYVFTHFLNHFYKEGVGIRQICDWCRLLWTYREKINVKVIEKKVRSMGLLSEWRAFGSYAVEYLGMPKDAMPMYSDEDKWKRKAALINDFILSVGNMGHNRDMSHFIKYPFVVRKFVSMGRRIGDLINHARIFPMDSLLFSFSIMKNGVKSAMRGEG